MGSFSTNAVLISLHFLIFYLSLSYSQIPLDSTLYASNVKQTWSSPNSTFYVGFTQLGPSTFIVGVNYIGADDGAGIPIWVAGGIDTTVDSGASFHFRSDGSLQLVHGSGAVVWDSGTGSREITSASIDDDGNLVLFNGPKSVWSTFENPTDTVVAGQNFTVNQTLRSEDYRFRFLDSGNLTLSWNDSVVYWNLQGLNSAVNTSLTSPILSLQQTGVLQISDSSLPNPSRVAYSSDYAEDRDVLRFLRLDSDGNLRMYSSARGTGSITIRWAGVSDQCQVFGYCGKMGICTYNGSSLTPVCQCPSLNFELVDASDSRKGCKRKVELNNCPGNETMLQLNNTRFLTYPPELDYQVFFVGITACRLNCVAGASCVAATSLSNGDGMCYLKTDEFISGYQNPTLPSTSYLKVCPPILLSVLRDPNTTPTKKKKNQVEKYVAILVPILVLFSIGIVGLVYYLRKKCASSSNHSLLGALKNLPGMPKEFQYGDLKKATNNFDEKNKLGKGGFGVVYKGLIAKENLCLAVKMFSREHTKSQGDFLSELTIINRLRHKHLVPLLGWCHMKGMLLLVYEYMPNGSLDKHLFYEHGDEKSILEWRLRYNVLVGVGSALNYLHNEFNQKVVHRDLKASNIMLDSNYDARLGDFGLARALDNEKTSYAELEGVPGTKGYIAPECFLTGKTSRDSDIYGFGAVILEVVCGKRPWTKLGGFNFLVDWVWWLHGEGRILDAVDERLDYDYVAEEAQRLLLLGLACSHPTASERPKADSICQIMAGSKDVPYVPPFKPAFLWPSDSEHDSNHHSRFNLDIISHRASVISCTMPR